MNNQIPWENVEHLVVFVHGVGMNGHLHGNYLEKCVQNSNFEVATRLIQLKWNVGMLSVLTLRNTLLGIKAGGENLLNELRHLFTGKNLNEKVTD